MAEQLKDGTGTGTLARVTADNALLTRSISEPIQHFISKEKEQAYQVVGRVNLAAGTIYSLVVENVSSSRDLVVTYIRHQIVAPSGGTALPNVNNYFQIGFGVTRTAGGTLATPVNVHVGSGSLAEVTAYQADPTVSGDFTEIDAWYTQSDADMNVFNKEGAVIIQQGQAVALRYVGDQTGGILYSRLSFLMWDTDE